MLTISPEYDGAIPGYIRITFYFIDGTNTTLTGEEMLALGSIEHVSRVSCSANTFLYFSELIVPDPAAVSTLYELSHDNTLTRAYIDMAT